MIKDVVQCKDCEYFDLNWSYCGSDIHYCTKHKCGWREDEFCSMAKPRDLYISYPTLNFRGSFDDFPTDAKFGDVIVCNGITFVYFNDWTNLDEYVKNIKVTSQIEKFAIKTKR